MSENLAKIFNISSADPSDIMAPEAELDARRDKRRALYLGEGLKATACLEGGQIAGEMIDIGIAGFGLFVEGQSNVNLAPGDVVSLEVTYAQENPIQLQCILSNRKVTVLRNREGETFGFNYLSAVMPRNLQPRRAESRFPVRDVFAPTAVAIDPIFFRENIFFQVKDCSASGLSMLTSSRNKSLIPGVKLDLEVAVPTSKKFRVACEVTHSHAQAAGDTRIVGVRFIKKERAQEFLAAMSEYLFAATNVSLQNLRKNGMPIAYTDKGLSFYYASSGDWDEILSLRFKAYKDAGKFQAAEKPEDMLDKYDPYSRQIICRVHEKIVACARIVFVDGDPERSEHIGLGLKLPDWLKKEKFCEFSRACTNQEYRSSDVFLNLIMHLGRIGFESGCRYSVVNCNDNTWPLYKSAGYKKIGITFDGFGVKNCYVAVLDLKALMGGSEAPLLGWNQIIYPIAFHLKHRGHGGIASYLRLLLHGLVYPLVKWLRIKKRL